MHNSNSPNYILSKNFLFNEDFGIYINSENQYHQKDISYNEEGHTNCFAVEDNSFWFSHRNQIIFRCLQNHFNKDEQFVDVGGGNGFVSSFLKDNGYSDLLLLEPNIVGAINAKKRGLNKVVCGILDQSLIEEQSISNIGIFDVIEHIEDHEYFAKQLYRALKPGGKLAITVPAFKSLWSYHDVQAGHFRRYTKSTISKLIKDAGFEIKYSSYFFSILLFPNFILRSIPSKLGFYKNYNDKKVKQKQHFNSKSLLNRIMSFFWKFELNQVLKQKNIPFGNSIILIARKHDTIQ